MTKYNKYVKNIKSLSGLTLVYLRMYLDYSLAPLLLVMHLVISMTKGAKRGWLNFVYDYKGAIRCNVKKLNAYKGELND